MVRGAEERHLARRNSNEIAIAIRDIYRCFYEMDGGEERCWRAAWSFYREAARGDTLALMNILVSILDQKASPETLESQRPLFTRPLQNCGVDRQPSCRSVTFHPPSNLSAGHLLRLILVPQTEKLAQPHSAPQLTRPACTTLFSRQVPFGNRHLHATRPSEFGLSSYAQKIAHCLGP